MRTRASAAILCILVGTGAIAVAEPHLIQSARVGGEIRSLAVAPSGKQICVSREANLRMRAIRPDGRLVGGAPIRTIDLSCASDAIISPDGKFVIAAGESDEGCKITIVRRGSWHVTEITHPDTGLVTDIDVTSQRPEAFIALASSRVLVVDFHRAEVVDELSLQGAALDTVGVRVRPDATRTAVVSSRRDGSFPLVLEWELRADDWSLVSACEDCPEMPRACCIGPDPEHLIVLAGDTSAGLAFFNTASGEFVRSHPTSSAYVRDIELTRDGAWAVVVDHAYHTLTAFVGEDMRAFIAPERDCDQIRTFECEVSGVVEGVTVHPTLPVAYAWSPEQGRIDVVGLGEPPL